MTIVTQNISLSSMIHPVSKNGFMDTYKPECDIILSRNNHPAVKPDIMVNSGALQLALNSLKRGSVSQQEIALELEKTIAEIK